MRALSLLVALSLSVLWYCPVVASPPHQMSYQGVLRDDIGNVVADGNYQITFRLYDSAIGGTTLWSEAQTVAVKDGILDVTLGAVNSLDLPFDDEYWLGVQIALEPELLPRISLSTVPYAFRAAVADSVSLATPWADGDWEIAGSDIYRLDGNVGIGTMPSYRLHVSGDVHADAYHGDGSNLTGVSHGLRAYSSGWIPVGSNEIHTISHGLGTWAVAFTVLFNTIPSDVHAQLLMPLEHRVNPDGNRISMCALRLDDENNVSIHTGNDEVAEFMDFTTGESSSYKSGYYRIHVLALD